jgi:lysophospholipase L1-like esterase
LAATAPVVTIAAQGSPAANVAVVGDSITNLARSDVIRDFRQYNLYLDAIGGTTMAEHLSKIQDVAGDGQQWNWVIELGTNDALPEPSNPNWATDFANEVAAVQSQRCVVFVTVNPRFGTIAKGIDQAIASAVASHPNFHTLDWGDIEFRKPAWLGPDGIHPTTAGDAELAKLMRQSIHGCPGQ